MNIQRNFDRVFYLPLLLTAVLTSCKKDNSLSSTSTSTTATIAVAASLTEATSGTAADSVYIVQPCPRGYKRDSIAQAALPAAVTSYLTANYSGYTFQKGFVITNSAGTTSGYVVVIYYNDKPVGIQFDSSGNFVRTLEQREKGDLEGHGWHHGGRFEDRDGLGKDTIALEALPSIVQSYMAGNYAGDTLVKAFIVKDSGYLVLSKNNGVFATLFDSTGNFVKRIQLPSKSGNCAGIDKSSLPANMLAYLDATYPNYVFKKAFSITVNGIVQGYVVVIDANNTKYALEFDAAGNFVKARTIW